MTQTNRIGHTNRQWWSLGCHFMAAKKRWKRPLTNSFNIWIKQYSKIFWPKRKNRKKSEAFTSDSMIKGEKNINALRPNLIKKLMELELAKTEWQVTFKELSFCPGKTHNNIASGYTEFLEHFSKWSWIPLSALPGEQSTKFMKTEPSLQPKKWSSKYNSKSR